MEQKLLSVVHFIGGHFLLQFIDYNVFYKQPLASTIKDLKHYYREKLKESMYPFCDIYKFLNVQIKKIGYLKIRLL